MRPELQKMLSHCGMEANSGSQTTLVCSNQQCSGPLYKGVRQSVSKKAEPPTETGPANKWLLVKRRRRSKPALAYATDLISQFFFCCCVPPSFIQNNSILNCHCEATPTAEPNAVTSTFLAPQPLWWCCTQKYLLTNLFALLACGFLHRGIMPVHLSLSFHPSVCLERQWIRV